MLINKQPAIVFDCGATNVRVIALDAAGNIMASKSFSNETDPDPGFANGRIWDLEKVWKKLCEASRYVCSQIDTSQIAGLTVTSFGVDGTLVDKKGSPLHPIISWQCSRTEKVMREIDKYIPLEKLYGISGVYPYAFNTINKFIWLKENEPALFDKARRWLFFPSLLINRLTGEIQNDSTMAGTSMMTDYRSGKFSKEVCDILGISDTLFGDLATPGDLAGKTRAQIVSETGIPKGTPVYFSGHDTQFAIFGSGADVNQPVLSSGTWEILMTRANNASGSSLALQQDLTTEADPVKGLYNIGQNWLGSGILEWFSKNFYPALSGNELYETMIREAENLKDREHGLFIDPSFYENKGNVKGGAINGLTIHTKREEIYLALLESLSYRLREGLEALQNAGNFKAEKIICVGGGSKNNLWNQLRANATGLPVQVIDKTETTVLGAACFVFQGAGLFKNATEARSQIQYNPVTFCPAADTERNERIYEQFKNFKSARKY